MNLNALFKLSYGLYIVSSKKDKNFNGQIVNTVFQATAEPPTIAICINKENLTHEYILDSKVFTVSILSQGTPPKLIGLFGFRSGREVNKFKDIKYKIGVTGAPIILNHTIGYLECELLNSMDIGTHTLFLGRLREAQILQEGEPLTYDYYRNVHRGKAPKTAPTYIKEEKGKEALKMMKYECSVCGYIYNPKNGDPDSGIKPGTPFEELPEDWVCPVCGAGKDAFQPVP